MPARQLSAEPAAAAAMPCGCPSRGAWPGLPRMRRRSGSTTWTRRRRCTGCPTARLTMSSRWLGAYTHPAVRTSCCLTATLPTRQLPTLCMRLAGLPALAHADAPLSPVSLLQAPDPAQYAGVCHRLLAAVLDTGHPRVDGPARGQGHGAYRTHQQHAPHVGLPTCTHHNCEGHLFACAGT